MRHMKKGSSLNRTASHRRALMSNLITGLIIHEKIKTTKAKAREVRPLAEKIAITQKFKERFWPMLEEGRLQPVIDTVFPIEEAQAAHRLYPGIHRPLYTCIAF